MNSNGNGFARRSQAAFMIVSIAVLTSPIAPDISGAVAGDNSRRLWNHPLCQK
jgi:hypothetical protein